MEASRQLPSGVAMGAFRSFNAAISVEHAVSAAGIFIALVTVRPLESTTVLHAHLAGHVLLWHVAGKIRRTSVHSGPYVLATAEGTPGAIGILPPCGPVHAHIELAESVRTLTVVFGPEAFDGEFTEKRGASVLPNLAICDPVLKQLMHALLHELERPGPMSRLQVESLCAAMAVRLAREHSGANAKRLRSRGGLAPSRLRTLREYIEMRLDHQITLADLASVARLSTAHLTRAFRQSMGISPHRFVLTRRVERAKDLLAHSDMSLAEVALTVGFASQSHLTVQFGRLVGTTPRRFRA